MLLSSFDINSD